MYILYPQVLWVRPNILSLVCYGHCVSNWLSGYYHRPSVSLNCVNVSGHVLDVSPIMHMVCCLFNLFSRLRLSIDCLLIHLRCSLLFLSLPFFALFWLTLKNVCAFNIYAVCFTAVKWSLLM